MNQLTIKDFSWDKESNGIHLPKKVTFEIRISTEEWDDGSKLWLYGVNKSNVAGSVEIKANENSGEDGVPAPVLNSISIMKNIKKFSSIEDIVGKKYTESPDDNYDGWFGNDAPPLIENELSFKEYTATGLAIEWSAKIGERGANGSLHFEGHATFLGVKIKVKKEGDEKEFIEKLFNVKIEEWEKNWERKMGNKITYRDFPDDRKTWFPITYLPKA